MIVGGGERAGGDQGGGEHHRTRTAREGQKLLIYLRLKVLIWALAKDQSIRVHSPEKTTISRILRPNFRSSTYTNLLQSSIDH